MDVEPVGSKSSEAEGGVVSIEVALALSVEGSPAKREYRGAVRCMVWLPPGMRTILLWGFGYADRRSCREADAGGKGGYGGRASLDKVPDDSIQLAKDRDAQLFLLSRGEKVFVLHQL